MNHRVSSVPSTFASFAIFAAGILVVACSGNGGASPSSLDAGIDGASSGSRSSGSSGGGGASSRGSGSGASSSGGGGSSSGGSSGGKSGSSSGGSSSGSGSGGGSGGSSGGGTPSSGGDSGTDAAPCVNGAACVPASASECIVGVQSCGSEGPTCVPTDAALGTPCSIGVCNAGTCVACSEGASCDPGNPCETGTLACSSGSPVCNGVPNPAANGMSCGENLECGCGGAGQCGYVDCSSTPCGASDGCGGTCKTGTCPSGDTCTDGQCVTCVPKSCAALNAQCGEVFDGCLYTDCGACSGLTECIGSQCQGPSSCTPLVSVKGSCTYFAPIDGGEIPRGCTDYSDNYTDGTADAAACTSEGGTWSTASCSHVGVTFGCEEFGIGGGASDCSLVTSWYYDSGSCIGGTVPVSP